ncbi:hypothetical protein O3P69_016198 [Scylla paramamosain]|uniref:Uncharacterized protein n=1 Tax=Scylla paramamosain TaxID=85552 RepID=A0AAW0SEB0_SCYPA
MERRRQEKVTLGGSLGTSFSGRCGARLEKVKDKRRASLKDWRTNLVVQFDCSPPTGSQTSVQVQVTPLTPSVRQLLSST